MPHSSKVLLSSAFVGLILALFVAGYAYFNLQLEVLLVLATAIAALFGLGLRFSWRELQDEMVRSIFEGLPSMLVVLCVGALIASWLAAGAIPMVVHLGLGIVSPRFFLVSALTATTVVSLFTGTAYGTLGTVGVAFMAIAQALDVPSGQAAGALIGGAYVGQKLSPFSANAILAATVARVSIYDHIRHAAWTTVPAVALAAGVYLATSHLRWSAGAMPAVAHLHALDAALQSSFRFTPWVLLPAAVTMVGPLLRQPLLPVIFASVAVASGVAIVVQGAHPVALLNSLVTGYDLSGRDPLLQEMLRQGGLRGMVPVTLIGICAFAFSGVVRKTRILDPLLEVAFQFTTSTRRLVTTTAAACLATVALTGSSFVSIVLPMQLFAPAFARRNLAATNLSRIVVDSAVAMVPLLPWTIAGAFLSRMLGVSATAYAPWAVACYGGLALTLLFGAVGFKMAPLPADRPPTGR
jgi:NhaC family Na+:H+ antiporter